MLRVNDGSMKCVAGETIFGFREGSSAVPCFVGKEPSMDTYEADSPTLRSHLNCQWNILNLYLRMLWLGP